MHKRWLLLSAFLILGLASCGQGQEETTPPEPPTSTPTQTHTPTPTNTPTSTPTSTVTQIPCFALVAPEDGAEFGTMGLITFQWSEQFGATQYQFEITFPSGVVESKVVEETTYERWLESLSPGGEYQWQVVAMDGYGESVCVAGPYGFTKPQYTSKQSGGSSESSKSCPNGGYPDQYGNCPPPNPHGDPIPGT